MIFWFNESVYFQFDKRILNAKIEKDLLIKLFVQNIIKT